MARSRDPKSREAQYLALINTLIDDYEFYVEAPRGPPLMPQMLVDVVTSHKAEYLKWNLMTRLTTASTLTEIAKDIKSFVSDTEALKQIGTDTCKVVMDKLVESAKRNLDEKDAKETVETDPKTKPNFNPNFVRPFKAWCSLIDSFDRETKLEAEKAKLQKIVDEQKDYATLKQTVQDQKDYATLKQTVEKQKDYETLKQTVEAQKDYSTLKTNLKQKESELTAKIRKERETEITSLKSLLEGRDVSIQSQKSSIDSLTKEIANNKVKLSETQAIKVELDKSKSAIIFSLEKDKISLNTTIKELKTHLAKLNEESKAAYDKLETEYKEQLEELERSSRENEETLIAAHKTQFDKLKEDYTLRYKEEVSKSSKLQAANAELAKSYETKIEASKRKSLETFEHERTTLTKEIQSLTTERNLLKQKIDQLSAELTKLNGIVKDYDTRFPPLPSVRSNDAKNTPVKTIVHPSRPVPSHYNYGSTAGDIRLFVNPPSSGAGPSTKVKSATMHRSSSPT